MKLNSALLVSFSATAFGLPSPGADHIKPSDWRPAVPGDARSPCPGLNSFANHGFLPHDGKGLDLKILKHAFKAAVNVGPDFAVFAGRMGIELAMDKKGTFDLDDLNVHNAIEHDSSLSRQDAYFGNFHHFNSTIFDGTAEYFQDDVINVNHMARARCARIRNSKKTNPQFSLSKAHRVGGYIESSLIVSVFGNPQTGIVEHPEYVTYWFRNRRLPYELGWMPRKHETNVTTLTAMQKRVAKATPQDCKGPDVNDDSPMH